jgi:hypothetical protein
MPTTQRGGRRLGAGRPRFYDAPLLRTTVRLTRFHIEALQTEGHGNLSEGIRRVVEDAWESWGAHLPPPQDPAPPPPAPLSGTVTRS